MPEQPTNPPDSPPAGPRLSVDVVPVAVTAGHPELILAKRQYEPSLGKLALPGVLVVAGESLTDACHRALNTKSGISPEQVTWMRRVGVHDSPVRDERGPTISISYLAVIDDPDAARRPSNRAYDLPDIPKRLPFDHNFIIDEAVTWAAGHLWDDNGSLARALLGSQFTTVAANRLLAGMDPKFNTTNTNRMLAAQTLLTKAATGPSTGGRPTTVWAFNEQA